MSGNNERLNLNVQQLERNNSLCSARVFADMCGVALDTVTEWMQTGTVPTVTKADATWVDIKRLRADLERGKDTFDAGDYSHG